MFSLIFFFWFLEYTLWSSWLCAQGPPLYESRHLIGCRAFSPCYLLYYLPAPLLRLFYFKHRNRYREEIYTLCSRFQRKMMDYIYYYLYLASLYEISLLFVSRVQMTQKISAKLSCSGLYIILPPVNIVLYVFPSKNENKDINSSQENSSWKGVTHGSGPPHITIQYNVKNWASEWI